MTIVAVLLFIVAAAFAVIVVATVLVVIGVRQEEAAKTAFRGLMPPTICALLARRVLGAHFYLISGRTPETESWDGDEDEPPWYERRIDRPTR